MKINYENSLVFYYTKMRILGGGKVMNRRNWYKLGQLTSVFVGGMLGGVSRYEVGNWLNGVNTVMGTTVVNLVGCFLLTFTIYGLDLNIDLPEWEILGIGTVFVGAFTTFSTFTLDFVQNVSHDPIGSFIFLTVNLIGGFLCVLFGYLAALAMERGKRIWK